jgi:hypothetical protein
MLDYKKEQRLEKVVELEDKLADKKLEFSTIAKRIMTLDKAKESMQGDYYLPDLALPEDTETRSIGIYGKRHGRYLKNHRKVVYTQFLTSCRLKSYLADIDKQV